MALPNINDRQRRAFEIKGGHVDRFISVPSQLNVDIVFSLSDGGGIKQ